MNFTQESQLAKDYVLLINNKELTYVEVPYLFNLREVVQSVLDNQADNNNN